MAITTMEKVYQLERTEVAFIPTSGDAPMTGKKSKLYIPRLMPEITMGEPKESKIPTKGASVFKNDPGCAIKADATMTSANYLEVNFEGNTKWTDSKATIDPESGTRSVEQGLRVTCHAESNVVKDMTFSNK